MFQVTLPAQSIFGNGNAERRPLHEYTDYVRANGQNLMSVVSRMSFDMDSSSTKVGFKPIRLLTDDEYDTCNTQSTTEDAERAIKLTVSVSKEQDSSDAFSTPDPIAATIKKPDPVVEEVSNNIPEPKKRVADKPVPEVKKTIEPKSETAEVSLDDLVSEWS